jgi:23S rRNA A1618 N6-methylase RlmF
MMCIFFIQVHVVSSCSWSVLGNRIYQWHVGTEVNSENILLPASQLKVETSK